MAATHLTLEEAAERLGVSPEEFKKRLKTDSAFKVLVPIRDGSTLRFKSGAIDELARQLGAASDPELPLAPMDDSLPPDSDDFKVPAVGPKSDKKRETPKKSGNDPLPLATSDDDIFSLASEGGKSDPKLPVKKSDSDARLEPGKAKKPKTGKDSDEAIVPTEELAIDFSGPGSAVIRAAVRRSSPLRNRPASSPRASSRRPTPRRNWPIRRRRQ